MSGLDPARRQQVLASVASWLDTLAEDEPLPAGLAPDIAEAQDPPPDLFSLLAQLAALTRETQLQGRATNRLHTELGSKLDTLAERQLTAETLTRALSDSRREARLDMIAELLEVRDRFSRGLDEAQRRLDERRGLLALLAPRDVLAALVEGNALARERLDDLLRRLDVQEIPCLGRPFDPTLMRAVEVTKHATAAAGTVLEVFRPGYSTNSRVLRFAEVRVAEAQDAGTQ